MCAGLDLPLLIFKPGLDQPPPGTGEGLRERDIPTVGVPIRSRRVRALATQVRRDMYDDQVLDQKGETGNRRTAAGAPGPRKRDECIPGTGESPDLTEE
jgi:hypothetical protein